MTEADLHTLTTQVLWGAFALSAVLGAIAQRTHFCTMGAVSDVVNMGDWNRMRQWGLAIGVGVIGFGVLAGMGLIDPAKTLYGGTKWLWLSALLGGGLFGFGMVLASGCGNKTLVRIGAGSLKSLVVFLVMAIAAFATLKGITALLRVSIVDRVALELGGTASLGGVLAQAGVLDARAAALWSALVVGGVLVVWALASRDFRRGEHLLAGFGIGAVLVAMWWLSGHFGHVAEHPQTLEEVFVATSSGRAEALTFTAPMAHTVDWLILFSDRSKVLTFGVASVLGVIAGACVMALASKTFRWEGFASVEDLGNHLVGGLLMGVGGVTAMGCTVGQGLSGISTLSLNSFVALPAIVAGAWLGLRYQMWRLERMA
jgi:uncharacterized membrane protein YedE/YeeE